MAAEWGRKTSKSCRLSPAEKCNVTFLRPALSLLPWPDGGQRRTFMVRHRKPFPLWYVATREKREKTGPAARNHRARRGAISAIVVELTGGREQHMGKSTVTSGGSSIGGGAGASVGGGSGGRGGGGASSRASSLAAHHSLAPSSLLAPGGSRRGSSATVMTDGTAAQKRMSITLATATLP